MCARAGTCRVTESVTVPPTVHDCRLPHHVHCKHSVLRLLARAALGGLWVRTSCRAVWISHSRQFAPRKMIAGTCEMAVVRKKQEGT